MSAQSPRRVLSPHLQVYRLPLNAWISLLHRITGLLWCLGLLGATGLLWVVAAGQGWPAAQAALGSPWGRVASILAIYALWFHWASGLRHLLFDFGFGFAAPVVRVGAWAVPWVALLGTGLLWSWMG